MQLAIVGIRGIPNNYGGFETLTEYLVESLSEEIDITVYCSSKDMDSSIVEYKGAKLRYIPISSHGASGIIYDSLALIHAVKNSDKVLFLGFGAGFVIPLLTKYKSKIILNIGGLDWKRDKWSPFAQKVIKIAESLLIRNSGTIVADNIGISDYIQSAYGRESTLIAYGGDQAHPRATDEIAKAEYPFLNGNYAFSVTRIQPDNNIDMILEAFSRQNRIPLVMVGNWLDSAYGIKTRKAYFDHPFLILLDAIYDREKLDILRSNCTFYVHGHSAGGTNPSLVEAMYLGLPVFAFSSGYNEYTTEHKALYFRNIDELSRLIKGYQELNLKSIGTDLKETADRLYRWKIISSQYKALILSGI